MEFGSLFEAFSKNAATAMLVVSLLAIGWLVRTLLATYDANAKAMQAAHDAHLQTAMQVAPLAAKLVTCVEVLERLSARAGGA